MKPSLFPAKPLSHNLWMLAGFALMMILDVALG